MRPGRLSGFVAADDPIAVSTTDDGANILLAIGHPGDRSFLWITPAHARSLQRQFDGMVDQTDRAGPIQPFEKGGG